MPSADFGEKVTLGSSNVVRMKNAGDKIRFRFIKGAVYDGKHFLAHDDGSKTVEFCPRIMANQPCMYCKKYFEALEEVKKLPKDSPKAKKLKDEASRKWKAAIAFYFPVIDRGDHKAKILQTTLKIREDLEKEVANGVQVMNYDWILSNTGSAVPAEKYHLSRVDSAETVPVTPEEEFEMAGAFEWNLEEKLGHNTKTSSLKVEETPEAPADEEDPNAA